MLEEFLADQGAATVLEDGTPLFDLAESRYSVSESNGKCLLHWELLFLVARKL